MMKFSGLLLKESLKDESVLDSVKITKTEIWNNVKNAVENQPKNWTAIFFEFEGTEDEADIKAEIMSRALRGLWYLNFSGNEKIYVVFPDNKFYKYQKGDKEKRQEAIDYGLTIGIPQDQLDWGE